MCCGVGPSITGGELDSNDALRCEDARGILRVDGVHRIIRGGNGSQSNRMGKQMMEQHQFTAEIAAVRAQSAPGEITSPPENENVRWYLRRVLRGLLLVLAAL